MRVRTLTTIALVLIAGASLLTGCAGSEEGGYVPDPVPTRAGPSPQQILVEEATERYEVCMVNAGWAPVITDTGPAYGFREEQADEFHAADSQCMSDSGLLTVVKPPTDEQPQDWYFSILDMRECLVVNGWEMPEPPSLQVYLESNASWSPYSFIDVREMAEAEEVCPQDGF